MSAFEELKAWCEKHLDKREFDAICESKSFLPTIYITCDGYTMYHTFGSNGAYYGSGECEHSDVEDHLTDYYEQNLA